jgi:UDP-N-acetylmuramate dehydrogenase
VSTALSAHNAQAMLSAYTTLGLGGPAARLTEAEDAEGLVAAVRAADAAGEPVLVLGGGSNLVVADAGFPGTVIRVATRGVDIRPATEPGAVDVAVAAGEPWDALVEQVAGAGLAGLECLSGIPGLAGATPIQNVGAYGQEVAQTITAVRALDRDLGAVVTLTGAQCAFGYRTSMLKRTAAGRPTGRHVVLEVTFRLRRQPPSGPALSGPAPSGRAPAGPALSEPVRYPQLAARLGVPPGARVPLADARAAVLDLRRGKGMVLDPADPDTRSAGSFFTNPVLSPAELAALERRAAAACGPGVSVPRFPAGDAAAPGAVKVPAAWLIEQAGFGRGYRISDDPAAARISTRHTLALTNPGPGTTAGLLALAAEITAGVRAAFGLELDTEPVLVGVRLA